MANNATETVIAANGAVSIAPTGTTLPTDASAALATAFVDLGYVSEDGVSFTPAPESEGINAWQSLQPIRYVLTSYDVTASFTLMQWNEDTLKLAFGGGSFVDNGDGTYDFALPKPGEITEYALVIDGQDGTKKYRIVLDRVQLSDVGDINFKQGEVAGLPITVTALAGNTEGRPGAIYWDAS